MEDVKQSLKPGETFAGKYRVDRILGEGGMGVVLGATHLLTQDRVALKFLLPQAAEHPDIRQRFLNEARAAVQIKSEHVARITDVDTTPAGLPYMVMEYLDGQDLGAVVASQGSLPLETAVDYLLQACEALAEAHALGIVHRDLKPANLFLTHRKDGSALVKVLDFGISKLANSSGQRLTSTRGAMGSPLYMSPEQMTNPKGVDSRSDVWSLGVVLYELLTAGWPFEADTMEGLVIEIVTKPARPIRARKPELPESIEEILGRCLAKDPGQRFASVAELADALVPFGSAQARQSGERISRVLRPSRPKLMQTHGRTIDPIQPPEDQKITTHRSWASTQTPGKQTDPVVLPVKRSPLPWLGAVVGLLLLGGIFAFSREQKESPATSAAERPATTSSSYAVASATAPMPTVLPVPATSASASAPAASSTPPAQKPPSRTSPAPANNPKAPAASGKDAKAPATPGGETKVSPGPKFGGQ